MKKGPEANLRPFVFSPPVQAALRTPSMTG